MERYCIGIDVGTTAIKGVLTDERLNVLSRAKREHSQFYPRPGWVEQDPEELFSSFMTVVRALIEEAGISPGELLALGIDHQGETCLVWDRLTGKPLYRAITWQDRRMSDAAESTRAECGARVRELTGLTPDSYYSAYKIRWILDNTPGAQERAERGELAAGTLNTYILWRLCGGAFLTDYCSAHCMMLFDPRESDWSEYLLNLFNIPRAMLPELRACDTAFAHTDKALFYGQNVAVHAMTPDAHAGMIGIGAAYAGALTTTYGTGCFMHLVTGGEYVAPPKGLTASCCCAAEGVRQYQLNGICYTAGSAVKWLKDGIGVLEDESRSSDIAYSVEDTNGVIFVPAFTGLATPFWDEDARGALLGLSAGVTRAHIVRSVLESIALEVATAYRVMRDASNTPIQRMFALGGLTANDFLMQYQADMLGLPVIVPFETEPAFGAARLALESAKGRARSVLVEGAVRAARTYLPQRDDKWRDEKLCEWNAAVGRCLGKQ